MKCKSCGAEICFVTTINGKAMPVDVTPEKRVVIIDGVAHIKDAYVPHWVTCSNPAPFKR